MNRRILTLLLSAVALLLLAGCLQGSIRERNTSFTRFAHAQVRSESLQDFLTSRTAVLIAGDHLHLTASKTNRGAFDLPASSRNLNSGSAAAVDQRGYFLSAAHCVEKESTYLAFGRRGQLQVEAARLVWRGDVSKGEPDLALLWVPCRLDHVFDLTSAFQVGQPVIAVGLNSQWPHFRRVSFAGTLRADVPGSGTDSYTRSLRHDAPLHQGDSGGPLAGVDGRLVGINVAMGRTFSPLHPLGQRFSVAEHPDPAWLQQLIEGHAALTKAANQSPNKPAAGDSGLAPLWQRAVKRRRTPVGE